jgi:SAM-dependent methyltransferase
MPETRPENAPATAFYRDHYRDYYDGPSEWRMLGALDKSENIVRMCEAYPHDRILEMGAGEGSILDCLARRRFGTRLSAADISESAVRAITGRGIPGLETCMLFDGGRLPVEDQSFDLVILSHVIEHAEHPRQLLYEAKRVGRQVFVEVPLEDTLGLGSDYTPTSLGHINFFSPRTIRFLVQSCGFTVNSQEIVHSSRPVYRYRAGALGGDLRYFAKEALRRMSGPLATRIATYHACLVCTPSGTGVLTPKLP